MKKLNEVLDEHVIDEQLKSGYKVVICPVCGNETFDDYFICPHCGWEHDGTTDIDMYSSVNNSSIENYKKTLKHI